MQRTSYGAGHDGVQRVRTFIHTWITIYLEEV